MKNQTAWFSAAAVLLAAGCKTTEPKPVTWEQQTAYFAKVRDPRVYGLHIYQTPAGIEYRGGGSVRGNQSEIQSMAVKDPSRPVMMLTGSLGVKLPVLLDVCASQSWFEFSVAQQLGARPVAERDVQLARRPGDDVAGCLSLIPVLRFGPLHVSNPLVYVRLADGPLGPPARGIEKPGIKGVIGWDVLKKVERIHLDYAAGRVLLSSAGSYAPDPQRLVAALPLVPHAGVCAVRGSVNGSDSLILIDPAGDFEFAVDREEPVRSVRLGDGPVFENPSVAKSPGGARLGARLLQNFQITVCPRAGMLYVERLTSGEKR